MQSTISESTKTSLVGEPSPAKAAAIGGIKMNEQYDTSKFTVAQDGIQMPVSDLTNYQAEQQICKLLTLIKYMHRENAYRLTIAGKEIESAGIEIK